MKTWLPTFKKCLPFVVTLICLGCIIAGLLPVRQGEGFNLRDFGRLPILAGGRPQPIDSLARNSLLQIREKQTANYEPWKSGGAKTVSATEWLLELITNPTVADTRPVFRIDHPQVKSLMGLPLDKGFESDGKHYSWNQLQGKSEALLKEMQRVSDKLTQDRDQYDKAVSTLWRKTFLYQQLKVSIQPPDVQDWPAELQSFLENRHAGRLAAIAQSRQQPYDKEALDRIVADASRFDTMERYDEFGKKLEMRVPMFLPPETGNLADDWRRAGTALMDAARENTPNFALAYYAKMGAAYRANDVPAFNAAVAAYRGAIAGRLDANLSEASKEQYFNHIQAFYVAMWLCVFAFLFAIFYWFSPENWNCLRVSSVCVLFLAVLLTFTGLCFRMWLVGRPPVINLYSSATFIALGAPVLGLILEAFWRNSIGAVVGSVIAGICLFVAHILALEKDTLEMLRAVLDTNFWLATHVVIVTLGYASTFVSGFLGVVFVMLGFFTPMITADLKRSMARMVYGILCFATLFSFVGTVLGGIWADQSWGRFWGWDPKENGAIIIVLWNALVLHARWGGLVRERGLLNLAVFGNIVTSWSWFGTNMLGIGLHSYGFMDAAFWALVIFDSMMASLIVIGALPLHLWQSPLDAKSEPPPLKKKPGGEAEPLPA